MSYNFKPYNQDQMYLMPPSLNEWVTEGSLARFVSDLINKFDKGGKLRSFYANYREDGWGNTAYNPAMMVKVIVYSYCTGVISSRKIAMGVENDVNLRYLSANQQPDFRTINKFRKDNLKALDGLFVEVLALCKEAGLVKLGRVALDGTKVSGNAALDNNRTRKAIEEEVKRILEEAERVDAEEDERYGKDKRGDELPEGFRTREERLRRLQEAAERLEEQERAAKEEQERKIETREKEEEKSGEKKRGRKPKSPEEAVNNEAKANITDPDSRIMKTRKGWVQGYNGQAMADCGSQVIVAQDLTQEENDRKQLKPMLERCEEQAGGRPKELLGDAGYWSEDNAKEDSARTRLFIATEKDREQRNEQREAPRGRKPCNATPKEKMERRLLTKYGKAAYKQRGSTIEPIFGQIKTRGLREFVLRGIEKVKTEWSLWCSTHNILKLWRSGYQFA
jgi:transposase